MVEKNHLTWIDLLNITACIGVLLLHCTNGQVHSFSGVPSVDWFIGLTTHSLYLWPVDVFFMISGFTLLRRMSLIDKNNSGGVKIFYLRRLRRITIPVFSWNCVYMLLYFAGTYIDGRDVLPLSMLVKKFFLFDFNGFMWFFVPLIMIYLSLPFFAVFVLNSSRVLLRLYLVIGLMLSFIPPLDPNFSITEGFSDIYLMGSRYLYFIVAGYYIGHYDISQKVRNVIYLFSALNAAIIFIGTIILSLYAPMHKMYFLTYTNIPCAVIAIGVFTFFKYYDWNKLLRMLHLNNSLIAKYSTFSLGIYLVQGFWFTLIGHFNICDNHIILKFILMYSVCVLSVFIIKHIPVLKKTI